MVAHFDRVFDLGLSPAERRDLVAYLTAIGNGIRPYERDGIAVQLKELDDFASVLEPAIATRDLDIVTLTVDTVGRELRDLAEQFPDRRNTIVTGGGEERRLARQGLKDLVLTLRRVGIAASSGRYDQAAEEYLNYRKLSFAAVPLALRAAQPWSLFDPAIHDAHFAALRQLVLPPSPPHP